MWITEFEDYRKFIKSVLKAYPKSGRGQLSRLAEHLNVAPITITQIMKGIRDFTPDQAIKVSSFFGFDERAREYFIFMIDLSRADTKELKTFYRERLSRLKEESEKLKNIVQKHEVLTDADKGVFYSNWYYVAVQTLTSMERYRTIDSIAECLKLSRSEVSEVVAFLIQAGLCTQGKDGKILQGTKSTYVDDKSPFVNNHRRNWRDKAREKFTGSRSGDLFYSAPVALSEKDAEAFKKELLKLIENFSKMVAPSPEETTMCLNIDWFKF